MYAIVLGNLKKGRKGNKFEYLSQISQLLGRLGTVYSTVWCTVQCTEQCTVHGTCES